MKKIQIIIKLTIFVSLVPTRSFSSENNKTSSTRAQTIQNAVATTYNYAAPIIYGASARLLSNSQDFVQTTIVPLFKAQNKTQPTEESIAEEFEEITFSQHHDKFQEDYKSGNLEASLKANPTIATNNFNLVISECFNDEEQVLKTQTSQEQIFQAFTIANELSWKTGIVLEPARTLAQASNKRQESILTAVLANDAEKIEPSLKRNRELAIEQSNKKLRIAKEQAIKKRDDTIKKATELCETESSNATTLCEQETTSAHQLYKAEIEKRRKFASIIAFNKDYLDKKSGTQQNINLEDYSTMQKYLALLENQK